MSANATRCVYFPQAQNYTFSICSPAERGNRLLGMDHSDRDSLSVEIGNRLAKARVGAKMTQEQAAEELTKKGFRNSNGGAIGNTVIANWEQGKRSPRDLRMVMALADIYGVSYSWLLCDPGAPESREEITLIQKFRHTDERGKRAIQGIADAQPIYDIDRRATSNGN